MKDSEGGKDEDGDVEMVDKSTSSPQQFLPSRDTTDNLFLVQYTALLVIAWISRTNSYFIPSKNNEENAIIFPNKELLDKIFPSLITTPNHSTCPHLLPLDKTIMESIEAFHGLHDLFSKTQGMKHGFGDLINSSLFIQTIQPMLRLCTERWGKLHGTPDDRQVLCDISFSSLSPK